MVQGLLKSFFLHILIIGLFMYGAELFKQNKRFEINEIPLDIVDISEVTVNKVENKPKKQIQKKAKEKNKSGFQPPVVKSKPKPPEFDLKKKKTVKKKKINLKDQEQKQKKRVDNILKSIEKIKSQRNNQNKNIKEDIEKIKEIKEDKEIKSVKLGEKLTISEKDAIRRQFYRCWIVPAGAKNIRDYKVSIKLKLNRDGEVINSQVINKSNLNNTFFRTLAESAIRAVNHPDCKKLKVPQKKYETWKETILDFDPSVMIN